MRLALRSLTSLQGIFKISIPPHSKHTKCPLQRQIRIYVSDRTGWRSDNAALYSERVRFEAQSGNRLLWVISFVGFPQP
jgi:hypothetical protein